MKVLLEILEDARQMLASLDDLSGLRAETRDDLRAVLQELCGESARLIRGNDEHDPSADTSETHREWLRQRGLEAIARGQYSRAMEFMEEGREAFPDDPEFATHLGLICWESGSLSCSERHYAEAMGLAFPELTSEPVRWTTPRYRSFMQSMEGRALCLYKMGRLDECLPLFDALATMSPQEYAGCRYLAGEVRHLMGDVASAIADYEAGPIEPATLYNLGLAQFQAGYRQTAAKTFIRAFVANAHIAARLLGRSLTRKSALPGYLGGREYAVDFVAACQTIWTGQAGALAFVAECFDHPQVREYIDECRSRGADVLASTHGARGQVDWLEQLAAEAEVDGLAQSITSRPAT